MPTPKTPPFDPAQAAEVVGARDQSALDPRGAILVSHAFRGSRWKSLSDLKGASHVLAERTRHAEGVVDGVGELRPHVVTAAPYEKGTFVAVSPEHPSRAALGTVPQGVGIRVDGICAPRAPAAAMSETCPIEIEADDGGPVTPMVASNGQFSVPITKRSRVNALSVRLRPTPGRWTAVTRLVFDREFPRTRFVPDVGWVLLAPPSTERRFTVTSDRPLVVEAHAPSVLRLEVFSAGGDAAVSAETRSGSRPLQADGTAVIIPQVEPGRLTVRSAGGPVSVAIAERVALEVYGSREDDDAHEWASPSTPDRSPQAGVVLDGAPETTRDQVASSPRPTSSLEASLGTLVLSSGVVAGTLRTGLFAHAVTDRFAFGVIGYRRRIESLGLWTDIEGFTRSRVGEPTFGAKGVLYEELDRLHLRFSGTLGTAAQRIEGTVVHTWAPSAFAEYSFRATRDFFILPRIGFNGVYTTAPSRPNTLVHVDDEVYNAYRARRPTFVFLQALLWYAPFFNDINYLRLRASAAPETSTLSHVDARPGAFLVFGSLDLTGYVDVAWYTPSDALDGRGHAEENAGLIARYDIWARFGSVTIQPGFGAMGRVNDQSWQLNAFVNLFFNNRRGLRDFSSLELDFPEQRGGGAPWRGHLPGGYQ